MYLYTTIWQDFRGKVARNRFYADYLPDAVAIVEDLTHLSAASWIELRQDGVSSYVDSPRFNQPATEEAFDNDIVVLEMESESSSSGHELKLHSVLSSYVNELAKENRINPFREISLIKSSEGERINRFIRGKYQYRNK